jgi:hypothetical protein
MSESATSRDQLIRRRGLLRTHQAMLAMQIREMPSHDQRSRLALALKRQQENNALEITRIDSALTAIAQWRP